MSENQPRTEFIKEQYIQYHEMRRQLNSFSWQIPSVAVVVIVLLLGIEPEKVVAKWATYPIIPAVGFLAAGLFICVMLVNLIRNTTILRNFEDLLIRMEREHGVELSAYAQQIDPLIPRWRRIRSSSLLMVFLACAAVAALAVSIRFWFRMAGLV